MRDNEFDRCVLRAVEILEDEADCGSLIDAVSREAQQKVHAATILYSLRRLESQGLIISWWKHTRPGGLPRWRDNYRITPSGERALNGPWIPAVKRPSFLHWATVVELGAAAVGLYALVQAGITPLTWASLLVIASTLSLQTHLKRKYPAASEEGNR